MARTEPSADPRMLILIVLSAPLVLAQRLRNRWNAAAEDGGAEPSRLARDLLKRTISSDRGGEIRTFGLSQVLRHRVEDATNRWRAAAVQLSVRTGLLDGSLSVLYFAGGLAIIAWLLADTIAGRGTRQCESDSSRRKRRRRGRERRWKVNPGKDPRRNARPTHGRVSIDDHDLADLDLTAGRNTIAGAFQDHANLELTAQHAIGSGDITRLDDGEATHRGLCASGDGQILQSLPKGLHTQLGTHWPGGMDLSGGQWQRLALARSLMRTEPLLLILDEPTSALDAHAEHALFEDYATAARTATQNGGITLLVTHRFSTVAAADLVIVMDDGRVTEIGTHADLMQINRTYAELYKIQADGYRECPTGRTSVPTQAHRAQNPGAWAGVALWLIVRSHDQEPRPLAARVRDLPRDERAPRCPMSAPGAGSVRETVWMTIGGVRASRRAASDQCTAGLQHLAGSDRNRARD